MLDLLIGIVFFSSSHFYSPQIIKKQNDCPLLPNSNQRRKGAWVNAKSQMGGDPAEEIYDIVKLIFNIVEGAKRKKV